MQKLTVILMILSLGACKQRLERSETLEAEYEFTIGDEVVVLEKSNDDRDFGRLFKAVGKIREIGDDFVRLEKNALTFEKQDAFLPKNQIAVKEHIYNPGQQAFLKNNEACSFAPTLSFYRGNKIYARNDRCIVNIVHLLPGGAVVKGGELAPNAESFFKNKMRLIPYEFLFPITETLYSNPQKKAFKKIVQIEGNYNYQFLADDLTTSSLDQGSYDDGSKTMFTFKEPQEFEVVLSTDDHVLIKLSGGKDRWITYRWQPVE